MKQVIFVFLFLFLCIGTEAQSLADKELERIASGVLAEEISCCPEDAIRYAGVVVMEIATGNVVADVSLSYDESGELIRTSDNSEPVPSGLGRSVLYLAMMPHPNIIVDTGDGSYVDAAGREVRDHNHHRGGYGLLDLRHAFSLNSDIALLKAAESLFEKNPQKLYHALMGTGISMGGSAQLGYHVDHWDANDVLGYTSFMSLLEQTSWLSSVAAGKQLVRTGEGDPVTLQYISSREALDSLRTALRECVTKGMGLRMNSGRVSVAGLTSVSPISADGYKGRFAAAFFPYERPQYTVGVYIWEKGIAVPTRVARQVIDWIACNRLDKMSSDSLCAHHKGWIHPAAR